MMRLGFVGTISLLWVTTACYANEAELTIVNRSSHLIECECVTNGAFYTDLVELAPHQAKNFHVASSHSWTDPTDHQAFCLFHVVGADQQRTDYRMLFFIHRAARPISEVTITWFNDQHHPISGDGDLIQFLD